jgi:hypothetical protein
LGKVSLAAKRVISVLSLCIPEKTHQDFGLEPLFPEGLFYANEKINIFMIHDISLNIAATRSELQNARQNHGKTMVFICGYGSDPVEGLFWVLKSQVALTYSWFCMCRTVMLEDNGFEVISASALWKLVS